MRHWMTAAAAAALIFAAMPAAFGQQQEEAEEAPLPTTMIVVDAQESNVFRIGIPDLNGAAPFKSEAGGISRNDFTLMPGYTVVGPRSIQHDTENEGLGMDRGAWSQLQVNGVIKGQVDESDGQLSVQMRFFWLARGASPVLSRTWQGRPAELRDFIHEFDNAVLEVVTGTPGPFGTRITYAKREGPGRKDVYFAGMDGFDPTRVSDGRGIAMLPSFGPDGHIWFTRLTEGGMFITRAGLRGRRVIEGNGLNMAPVLCDGRIYFASSRDGNSEIYSADPNGRDVRRLTTHPAIDVSPACVPGGKIAFVSARHGNPQIWMMDRDGSNPRRITYKGDHNQTPAVCPLPGKPFIAFTGRDDGTLDIFAVNYQTQEYMRVTQAQGMNKDPAWSPDCRLIAFTSERRTESGIFLASPQGFNQHRVVEGAAETVDWQN